jgi:hypothetical protein
VRRNTLLFTHGIEHASNMFILPNIVLYPKIKFSFL